MNQHIWVEQAVAFDVRRCVPTEKKKKGYDHNANRMTKTVIQLS